MKKYFALLAVTALVAMPTSSFALDGFRWFGKKSATPLEKRFSVPRSQTEKLNQLPLNEAPTVSLQPQQYQAQKTINELGKFGQNPDLINYKKGFSEVHFSLGDGGVSTDSLKVILSYVNNGATITANIKSLKEEVPQLSLVLIGAPTDSLDVATSPNKIDKYSCNGHPSDAKAVFKSNIPDDIPVVVDFVFDSNLSNHDACHFNMPPSNFIADTVEKMITQGISLVTVSIEITGHTLYFDAPFVWNKQINLQISLVQDQNKPSYFEVVTY